MISHPMKKTRGHTWKHATCGQLVDKWLLFPPPKKATWNPKSGGLYTPEV